MGFLESGSRIYNTIQWGGYANDLAEKDVVSKLKVLTNAGYQWDASKSKLVLPHSWSGMQTDTPWVHTSVQNCKLCSLDHNVIFNNFGIIPQRCMDCWKICCTIPDFNHLMRMKQMQQNWFVTSSKCGIELRDYTPKHYGAYFYTGSLDEGRDVFPVLKEKIEDEVGPDVHIILKRACTEFEIARGPSPAWYLSPAQKDIIELIEHYVDHRGTNIRQDDIIKIHVMAKWMLWAHANGDMSYVPYNGGMKLFADYVQYQEGDIDEIKEMMVTKVDEAKNSVKQKEVATTDISTVSLSETPKEMIGDHDELT